jgi:predicted MFS family arabinose efflux permease
MASLAIVTLNLAPELELQLRHELALTPGIAGRYFLVELGAMAAASFVARRWRERLGGPGLARAALALWVAGNATSLAALPGFGALLATRALAGLGAGLLMMLALNAAATSRAPGRLFALYVVAQLASGAALLAFVPAWMALAGGLRGAYVLNLLLALPALWLAGPLGRAQPQTAASGTGEARETTRRSTRAAWQLGVAATLFNLTVGALWTFVGEFAQPLGIAADRLATLLSLSTLAGLVAAGSAAVLAARGSQRTWLASGVIGLALGAATITFARDETGFAVGCLVLSFAWNFSAPWLFALGAAIDGGAALMPVLNLAFAAGLAVGPPLAGWVVDAYGLHAMAGVALALLCATLALLVGLDRRRSAPAS